ncbi:MAG: formate dehydrogenase subunit gamma [Alphaproteobacteria bacterium]
MTAMTRLSTSISAVLCACAISLAATLAPTLFATDEALAQQVQGRAIEQVSPLGGNVPGGHLGTASDAEIWRAVRMGIQGNVSIPNKRAGVMIQSEGENWRAWRNGPITTGGAWGMLGIIALIALFFVFRGRVRIEAGPSGKSIERFNEIERFAHWLSAVSFILLALTGLNLLYGRHVLLPVLGPDAFAALSLAGKYVHNYVSFAFMAGLVLMLVLWARHNIPNKHDLVWLVQFGGLLTKGVHPPSRKFNAGQKGLFWIVILGGASMAASGVSLLFPFEFSMFEWTFGVLNTFGAELPATLTPLEEMQWSQWWHAIMALIVNAVILGHIYLGSMGMEGAFDAMGTGHVDENWAREHHSLWVAEVKGETGSGGTAQPAE